MINFRRFAAFALCTLVLSACEIRSWLTVDMSTLTSGTVTVQFGFDDEFRDAMEEFSAGTDLLAEIENEAPAQGFSIERFTDGDIEGLTLTKEFSSLEELREILESGVGTGSGPQEGLVEGLSVSDTGSTIRFEASVAGMGATTGDGSVEMPELEGLLKVDGRVQVSFPGEVIDHNGELEGRTVTWTFDETQTDPLEMFAEARKGSNRWPLIIGIILGLGVIGMVAIGIVVWLILSKRNRQPRVVSVAQQPNQPTDLN